MSTPALPYLIRDAVESDITACLALDHNYETEHVWQVRIHEDPPGQTQITFNKERLPRVLALEYPSDETLMRQMLPHEQCFLVAANREDNAVLGYLLMSSDLIYRRAHIHDVVVSQSHRRQKIGLKLMSIARQWAREKAHVHLSVQVQTRNYPGIQFCLKSGLVLCGFNDHYFPNQDIAVFFGQSLR